MTVKAVDDQKASVTDGEHCAISCFEKYLAPEGYHWTAKEGIEHSEVGVWLAPYLENEALIKHIKHNSLLSLLGVFKQKNK